MSTNAEGTKSCRNRDDDASLIARREYYTNSSIL